MINNRDFNKIEELTKEEFNRLIDENNFPRQLIDKIYDELYDKEIHYRKEHGESWSPNSNLCKYCRNNNQKQKFCWDCDKGSLYTPTTRPLFNLLLMYLSLGAGIESANNKLQQAGFRDALRVLLQPFGIDKAIQKYKNHIIDNDCNTFPKIEKAKNKYKFKQPAESEIENKEREKKGTLRCHENACTHCKYNDRFNTVFCYNCDSGSNFRNGIRSIDTTYKYLMYINTAFGKGEGSDWKLYFAEGLKWAIAPYIKEENLIEKYGFEYVTQNELEEILRAEDEDYKLLDEGEWQFY